MAKGNVTKRAIDALQPGQADAFLWDNALGGFGVKVTPAGRKKYVFQYRVPGRTAPVRVTLGEHGPMTAEQARDKAMTLKASTTQGIDPVAVKRKTEAAAAETEREAERARLLLAECTVAAMAERWLERVQLERPASYRFYEPCIRVHILPLIGATPMPELTRADAIRVIDTIPAARPALRRSVFATARRLWNWSVKRIDLPELSPFEQIEAPQPVASRARVLNTGEIAAVWTASAEMSPPFRAFYRVLLVSGQRRDEVAGMAWQELDREAGLWTLPGTRTKNSVAHIVPLSPLAVSIIDELAGGDDWPTQGYAITANQRTPIAGFSKAKTALDALAAQIADKPIDGWRVHDLRRTVATGLQALGVRFEVTEAVLNHVSGSRSGVAGVYQRHDWKTEKRLALDAWAVRIIEITSGTDRGGVADIREARRVKAAKKSAA